MNWNYLTELNQLDQLIEESNQNPAVIFKHSKSCSISSATLGRLERNWNIENGVNAYFLDLLAYREISNAVSERFGVYHESPQVLIIDHGKAIYDRSHFDINFNDIKGKLALVKE